MAIEAPVSKFRKTNIWIGIAACIILGLWFGYDGYLNENFQQKHTSEDGEPDSDLIFNRKSPPFFLAGAAALGVYLLLVRKRKLSADDDALVLSNGKKIPYDSIEQIDKTEFEKKGHFTVTYKDQSGKEVDHKISDRKFDNTGAILEHLVEKIT